MSMAVPKELTQKLQELQVLSHEIRFKILTSLYCSDVLGYGKHSQTFTDLMNVLGISNPDLAYHLNLLMKTELIEKKDYPKGQIKTSYYHITGEGKRVMKITGLSENQIREIGKKVLK
jgi:DNA-binding HxlR family transcriptional regulator